MFSFLFENAYLGELLAPPLESSRGADWRARLGELKALIKADKSDEALQLLERTARLQQDEIDACDDRDGLNLLHVACAANAVKLVIELLNKREASVNQRSNGTAGGNSPLHYAAINGHANLVDLLLRYGADQSVPNDKGQIPLEIAWTAATPETALEQPTPRSLLQNRAELVDSLLSPTALFHQRSSALQQQQRQQQQQQRGGLAEQERLHADVLAAARETAAAMNQDATFKKYRHILFVKGIYPGDRPADNGKEVSMELRETLRRYPALATARTEADTTRSYCDGYTPLHAAASVGYCEMIEFLLTLPGVSAWVRDPQGKTPLHVCAEHAGKCSSAVATMLKGREREYEKACTILREAMRRENGGIDPVGADAPVDLMGNTPLGCFVSRDAELKPGMRSIVFSPGDRCALPIPSPVPERSGCSPWRPSPVPPPLALGLAASPLPEAGAQFVYAFSEARGFKRQMEDFTVARCPLDAKAFPSWSVFGVCDGHGGAAASSFVSARFPVELLRLTAAGVADHLTGDEPAVLTRLLEEACASTEQSMREAERFAVQVFQRDDTGQPTKLAFQDGSGSTGIFCLATLRHLAVANVGDSRAVLAQVRGDAIGSSSSSSGGGSSSSSSSSNSSSSSSSASSALSPRSEAADLAHSGLLASALSVDMKLGKMDEHGRLTNTQKEQEAQDRVKSSGATLVEPTFDPANNRGGDRNFRATLDKAEIFDFEGNPQIRALGGGSEPPQLTVGARVEARNRVKQAFLPATIAKVHANGLVDVAFDAFVRERKGADGNVASVTEALDPQLNMSAKGYYSATGVPDKVRDSARAGNLAVARAFGDFFLKQNDRLGPAEQAVSAVPEVQVFPRGPRDAFVLLASDGVFDVMSDQQAVDFLGARLGYSAMGPPRVVSAEDVARACDALLHHCLVDLHSCDNLSCVVVILGETGATADGVDESQTPTKTPSSQPVLTPSSGTTNTTPVHETISRISDPDAGDKAPLTADVKRHLFEDGGES